MRLSYMSVSIFALNAVLLCAICSINAADLPRPHAGGRALQRRQRTDAVLSPAAAPSAQPSDSQGIAMMIGQQYQDEWESFATAVKTPAGISLYCNIYGQGFDQGTLEFLTSYAQQHPNGNVVIGCSWKDDMTVNGYTAFEGARLNHDIAGGKYDTNVIALAAQMPSSVNILLRLEYEVSPPIFANTNPAQDDPATYDLTAYPAAFAHLRSLISSRTTASIEYIYHPVRGTAATLYPGDAQVDIIGFSVFNNDVCLPVTLDASSLSNTFSCSGDNSTIDPNLLGDIQWAPKPNMVVESTAQVSFAGTQAHSIPNTGNNGFIEYLSRVKDLVTTHGFIGWVYINSDWVAHGWDAGTWGDSRVEKVPEVQSWFEENVVQDGRFTFA